MVHVNSEGVRGVQPEVLQGAAREDGVSCWMHPEMFHASPPSPPPTPGSCSLMSPEQAEGFLSCTGPTGCGEKQARKGNTSNPRKGKAVPFYAHNLRTVNRNEREHVSQVNIH